MNLFSKYTSQQKWLIAMPIIVGAAYSFFVFVMTLAGKHGLAKITQEMIQSHLIQYFFLTTLNLIPTFLLSLLLAIHVNTFPNAKGSLKWLLACGLVGGFFPVIWFYWVYYLSNVTLYPIAIALYGLPAAFFFGMIAGYTIGRLLLAKYPTLFGD